MLRANYTEEDQRQFQQLRYSYPDERIMRRFEILWLHACGKFAPEIATIVKQNPHTVRDVINMFKKGGIKLVTTIDSNHPTSELEKHRASLVEEFTLRPPASAKEAAARIKKLTGIQRSEQRVRVFMTNLGMKFRKTAAIPAKADLEKQEEFKKKVLEPEIASAKAGQSVLLFMDGVHFVQAAFLGCLWCFTRIFIRSPSGRKRWNVLGAYNAISGQLTTVANDGYITATTVCELLRLLAKQYAGLPIVIVLDNARYQHCKLVEELAKELGITLQFLPSYSPNLNLIERLWKFVKKACLYNVYYETFADFTAGINDCLSRVETDYKNELETLMQPNFQNLKNVSLLAL
jgi:transposase